MHVGVPMLQPHRVGEIYRVEKTPFQICINALFVNHLTTLKLLSTMRRKYNVLIRFTVWLIENYWQKRFGIYYNKKYRICCRFYPKCSDYAILALKKYGFFKGVVLTYKRIRRCTNENTDSCYDYP